MSVPLRPRGPLLGPNQRVLTWTRLGLALHALGFNVLRLDTVAHPGVLLALTAGLLVWSLVMFVFHHVTNSGYQRMIALEVVLAVLLALSTRWVVGRDQIAEEFVATSVFWQAIAPLAAAVTWGSWVGLATAVMLSLVIVVQTPHMGDSTLWSLCFVLCMLAWGAGRLVDQLRTTMVERDRSITVTAALAERDRMNRIVHDGALQVLSLVEREGRTLGPRGERLAQLARQQEIQLRTLLQDRTVESDDGEADVDVATMLDAMSSERVTVSLMAGSVMLPPEAALELKAAVAQILLNTELHAGPEAQTWMLLEEDEGQLILSVRDNGVGMSRDEVRQAFESGRMGIRESIIGRIRDMGGSADLSSSPGRGVEWELRIPMPETMQQPGASGKD